MANRKELERECEQRANEYQQAADKLKSVLSSRQLVPGKQIEYIDLDKVEEAWQELEDAKRSFQEAC